MFNDLYYAFRAPRFKVVPDLRTVRGILSGTKRQIDVAVYNAESERPVLAVECKRYARALNIKDVESFVGMLQDLEPADGMLVSPLGFSRAAHQRASAAKLILHELSERDAIRLNWRSLAREAFPCDEHSHPEMGSAFDALLTDGDTDACLEALDTMPFEEWQATIDALYQSDSQRTLGLLLTVPEYHCDSGWRYNALQLLENVDEVSTVLARRLLTQERDAETRELLVELGGA